MDIKHARTNRMSLEASISVLDEKEIDLYKKVLNLAEEIDVSYQSKETVLHLVNEVLFQKLVSEKN
ncbi:hypothetical protein [Leuconostoc mesenteroides]|uniref:hypothetical protein n=1 Tax=Leuconostoc mesenteroides TaxID=1245 RepID=UPI001CBA8617|nr:hypothetical protein [Leuconostoc mesenteroides]MBZ1508902.1 hypothetical protein [Leuconostoc mesenteroides]MBZ1532820.1 hypothetical protein [Leuconostoc mesenteroides]